MVEFSIVVFALLVLTGGMIDMMTAFYQWNSATKAMQLGARLAAVSDPVDTNLKNWNGLSVAGTTPGGAFPAFSVTCSGTTASCTCTGGAATCTYNPAAMNTIVYGRALAGGGMTTCGPLNDRSPAMCDLDRSVKSNNVSITYAETGLGFAGNPAGPVPTITLRLTGLKFNFLFLNGLLGLPAITMPAMTTTETGEDMCSSAPDPTTLACP
jgi:hypothetical protein